MSSATDSIIVSSAEMQTAFQNILLKYGFEKDRAIQCAAVFTNNSVDGIYTHGVNRFPRFVQYIKKGFVKIDAIPTLQSKFGGIEQWNGNLGPGPLNAIHATETVMRLAQQHGIGCVALSNTNHWMRGGMYGWQAAKAGYVFIGWTNTLGNMPAWGATDAKLGNNPLVIALPHKEEAIVLDMAMSQYSFGSMELSVMKNEPLPVFGGYNEAGELTKDPAAILASWRPIPVGYWKGAGLSLLLDLLATILSGGLATHEISKLEVEYGLSQVFIAIDISKLGNHSSIANAVESILNDYHQSITTDKTKQVTYPGERVLHTRKNNLVNGIPVVKKVWDEILGLQE
jgi:3-dehydro-L-gulonate 2-dehydrogenase